MNQNVLERYITPPPHVWTRFINLVFYAKLGIFIPRSPAGHYYSCVRFVVFMVVTVKNAVFWDMVPCRYCVNQHFGGTYHLHLQGKKSTSEEPV
jgi:hypothetical protein